MKISQYGHVEITDIEAFDALYSNSIKNFNDIYISDHTVTDQFNQAKATNADKFNSLQTLVEPDIEVENWDQINQNQWFIPENYQKIDLISWLFDQCTTDQQTSRVTEELELFVQHNMVELLHYLKYLVDTMRNNNIVWGVGRGSSVSSYVLFLIGIHKVDSIKYELNIREFLK